MRRDGFGLEVAHLCFALPVERGALGHLGLLHLVPPSHQPPPRHRLMQQFCNLSDASQAGQRPPEHPSTGAPTLDVDGWQDAVLRNALLYSFIWHQIFAESLINLSFFLPSVKEDE